MTSTEAPVSSAELAGFPFLRGLDPAFLAGLLPAAERRSYPTGAEIVREGSDAREFFLVLEGKVGLEVSSPERPHRILQTLGSGEVLGWSWLVPPNRWHFDARALKPTRLIALEAPALRTALAARPEVGFAFLLRLLPVIAERLENARLQLLDIHGA